MKKTMIWKAVKGWHILGKIRSPFLTPCLERQKQKIFAFFPFPYLTRGPLTDERTTESYPQKLQKILLESQQDFLDCQIFCFLPS